MNVLQYTHAGGSGAARYVANLSGALATSGINVDLLCPSDFAYADEVSARGVRVIHGPRSLAGAVGRSAKLGRALRQSFVGASLAGRGRNAPVLIHMNFVGIPLLCVPLIIYLRLLGRVVILTVHDVLPHRQLLGKRLWPLERLLLRTLYQAADHLVVHYASAAGQLRREFRIHPDRVTVISHGTDIWSDAKATRPAEDRTVRLAVLGSLRRNKGVHLAIAAVQELRRRGVDVDLTIAGRVAVSDVAYWQMCQTMIDEAPGGFLVKASFLSDAEMHAYMLAADAVILPYDSFEAQSGVAIDALATGRAIIATTAGGLGELLERSGAGLRIEEASPEAVSAAIEGAVGLGREGLAALGAAGSKYAREQLDWPRVADCHRALYRKLVSQS